MKQKVHSQGASGIEMWKEKADYNVNEDICSKEKKIAHTT